MANVAIEGPLSSDEYLAGELQGSTKHEYVRGEVFARSGTTDAHNDVAGNLYTRVPVGERVATG